MWYYDRHLLLSIRNHPMSFTTIPTYYYYYYYYYYQDGRAYSMYEMSAPPILPSQMHHHTDTRRRLGVEDMMDYDDNLENEG